MLSRLDRYIFRAAALPFLLILACTTAVAWLTQVLQRMDIIVDDGGTLSAFFKITMLLIPTLAGVVMPIALLAACLYTLNVLLVDSEIPVMRAAGASKFRIARPLLLLSLVTAAAMLFVNLDLQPRSYRAMKDTIWDVRSDIASSLVRDQVFTEVTPGVMVYAEDVRPGDQFVGLHIFDDRNPERETTYTAENGLFAVTPTGPRLFLLRGTAQYRDPETGGLEIARFTETTLELAELGEGTQDERVYEGTERYIGELLSPDMTQPYDRIYAGRLIAEGHSRLATPLYCIAFALMAAAFMLTATTVRRGYGKQLLFASAAAAGVRIFGFLAQSVAADAPVFNAVQYALPALTIGASMVVLINPRRFSGPTRVGPGAMPSQAGAAT
ncbi:MAG: LptF/LptG family permease [Parvularcula sp.]|jgi:lipopolysaccharide export system permease protein|nr:LptF/LptG family permease [Parvularcula sp.]